MFVRMSAAVLEQFVICVVWTVPKKHGSLLASACMCNVCVQLRKNKLSNTSHGQVVYVYLNAVFIQAHET